MSDTGVVGKLVWIARIWSVASFVFVLAFVFGEAFSGHGIKPTAAEWLGLAFWPGGVLVGLGIGWIHPRIGGVIATGSLLTFYVWNILERGTPPTGPFFLLVTAPGILFLLTSLFSKRPREMRPT